MLRSLGLAEKRFEYFPSANQKEAFHISGFFWSH